MECDNSVASELHLQKTPAAVNLIPGILERGVEVMLFAGDEDLICNYVGIERTIERLKWSGGQGLMVRPGEPRCEFSPQPKRLFQNATTAKWYVNGTYAGSWRTGRNMTYVRVSTRRPSPAYCQLIRYPTGRWSVPHGQLIEEETMSSVADRRVATQVGYDVPVASSDMMLRFMGVDMAAVAGDSAMMPSRLGDKDRVQLGYVGDSAVPAGPSGPAKSHNWEGEYRNPASPVFRILISLGQPGSMRDRALF